MGYSYACAGNTLCPVFSYATLASKQRGGSPVVGRREGATGRVGKVRVMKPQDMEEHVKAWQERWRQEGIRGAGAKRAGAGAAQVLAQAKKYRLAGDLSQAEAVLQEALTSYPDDPLLQGQLAWVKLAEGDLVSAEHLARAALGQRPQDPSALAALAEVFRRQRRYAEAEDFLRVAAEQATTTFAVTRLAALYLETGNREAAEEVLQQALVRHPEDAQLRAMLARVYAAQGDNRRALAPLRRGHGTSPGGRVHLSGVP